MAERIVKLENREQWKEAYKLLLELDPTLEEAKFLKSLEQNNSQQILLFGLQVDDKLLSVATACPVALINGEKVLWIFDMVTTEQKRSQGFGTRLVGHIEKFARDNGYAALRVHSMNLRTRAHHFYQDLLGFDNWSMVFKKSLS